MAIAASYRPSSQEISVRLREQENRCRTREATPRRMRCAEMGNLPFEDTLDHNHCGAKHQVLKCKAPFVLHLRSA